MTLEQIEALLAGALVMRSPVRDPDGTGRAHVERLENYMLESAQINGGLVEARHWLRLLESTLTTEWDRLQGWEVHTTKPRAKLTKQDIEECKVKACPEKHAAIAKCRQLRASVDDQIVRFEREERVVSRAYTMATGG